MLGSFNSRWLPVVVEDGHQIQYKGFVYTNALDLPPLRNSQVKVYKDSPYMFHNPGGAWHPEKGGGVVTNI